jgi:GDP-L-fucose synthase
MALFWNNKHVLITGGAGFVGSHVVELLLEDGARVRVVDNLSNGTLENLNKVKDRVEFIHGNLENLDDCKKSTKGMDVVLNLAAKVGGIKYNVEHPGTMFRDNVIINTNMLEAARINTVERFLVISSACVYTRYCKIPTPESEGFVGTPEPTNFGYGWAKRMAEIQADAYCREFNMKIAIARPYNAYGPRDHFDPEKSHVIPALIKRIFDGENPLTVWGNGEESRAFIYVRDLARGMLDLIEKHPEPDPVNIGTDEEMKIKELVKLLVGLSGTNPQISFDTSKPAGQPRRNCDTTRAKEKIGFVAKTKLEDGLRNTIEWYKEKYLETARV